MLTGSIAYENQIPITSYFLAKQPMKSFDHPLMRVSLSNSILVIKNMLSRRK